MSTLVSAQEFLLFSGRPFLECSRLFNAGFLIIFSLYPLSTLAIFLNCYNIHQNFSVSQKIELDLTKRDSFLPMIRKRRKRITKPVSNDRFNKANLS